MFGEVVLDDAQNKIMWVLMPRSVVLSRLSHNEQRLSGPELIRTVRCGNSE